jgi:hypothetical protein
MEFYFSQTKILWVLIVFLLSHVWEMVWNIVLVQKHTCNCSSPGLLAWNSLGHCTFTFFLSISAVPFIMSMLLLECHKDKGWLEVGIVVGLKGQSDPVISFACFHFLYFSPRKSCEWEAQSPHFYSGCMSSLYCFSYSSQPYRCLFFGRGLIKLLRQVKAIKAEQNMNEAHYISWGGERLFFLGGYYLSCCTSFEWGMMSVKQSVNWEFTGEI